MVKVKVVEIVIKEYNVDTDDVGVALFRINGVYGRGEEATINSKPCGISHKIIEYGHGFRSADVIPEPKYDL